MPPKLSADVDGDVTDLTKGYVSSPANMDRPQCDPGVLPATRTSEDSPDNQAEDSSGDSNPSLQRMPNMEDMSERGANQRAY